MEQELDQQKDISLAPEKMSLTSDTLEKSSTDQRPAIKSKILNSIDKIKKKKKCADLNAIIDYILKTELQKRALLLIKTFGLSSSHF